MIFHKKSDTKLSEIYPRLSYTHEQLEAEREQLDQVEVVLRKKLELNEQIKGLIHVE